jgi:hypothetical protein
MLFLGGAAQVLGPSIAVVGSTLIGVVALAAWSRIRPEVTRIP